MSQTNAGASIIGLGIAVGLIFLFGAIASRIVLGSSGIIMFLMGAGLAYTAGFWAAAIPSRALPQASPRVVAHGLSAVLALHYLSMFSQIQLFSKTSFAYALAIAGAVLAGSKR